jgi:hypothetical protein
MVEVVFRTELPDNLQVPDTSYQLPQETTAA